MIRTGGQIVVDQFSAEGVERVFCVPGESYLPVLDAFYDVRERIDLISCRHEGGAAMMAAASGQLSGMPGVAFVTRGPGATNASIAVHIAQQGSMPMVLCVGQVPRCDLGREAFQEIDLEAFFHPISKAVRQVDDVSAVAEAVMNGFDVARSGRRGPVVLIFPEDVLCASVESNVLKPQSPHNRELYPEAIAAIGHQLEIAQRPLLIVGGGYWTEESRERLHRFVDARQIPVYAAWRRLDIVDQNNPCYAGCLGLNTPEEAWERVARADCLLVIGARLDEPTTNSYQVPSVDRKGQILIHVYEDEAQIGRNFKPDIASPASIENIGVLFERLTPSIQYPRDDWCAGARVEFLSQERVLFDDSRLDLGRVMADLNKAVSTDAIVTVDAGNFTVWPQRYRRYSRPGRFLAPINGAMGYGFPAAIAASLAYPKRTVIGCAGDGGMLMTGMEMATAIKYGAKPIILVFNNCEYGTIAMHQQRTYPGREIGNDLTNPDFVALARSFGAFGLRVERTAEFSGALEQALAADTVALIELAMNSRTIE